MKTWTRQEYYDALVQAAGDGTFPRYTRENAKLCLSGIRCLYRGEGKKRCAAGLLMPDEKYEERFDQLNMQTSSLPVDTLEAVEGFHESDYARVQNVHDSVARNGAETSSWDAANFIARLNMLDCFRGVQKQDPGKVSLQGVQQGGEEGET